jgi:cytochrome P450
VIPEKYVSKMNPSLHLLFVLQRVSLPRKAIPSTSLITNVAKDLKTTISNIANGRTEKPEHATIFHEVLESDLPPEEKGLQRLGDEAQTIVGAGLETTAWALTHAAFYLINQPETLHKLQDELRTAIPNPKASIELAASGGAALSRRVHQGSRSTLLRSLCAQPSHLA